MTQQATYYLMTAWKDVEHTVRHFSSEEELRKALCRFGTEELEIQGVSDTTYSGIMQAINYYQEDPMGTDYAVVWGKVEVES